MASKASRSTCHSSRDIGGFSAMNIQHRLSFLLFLGLCLAFAKGCGGGESGEPAVAPPNGDARSIGWDPSPDATVSSYNVYYGTRSGVESGSCDYEYMEHTSSPSVTLEGLLSNTRYFVSVSAFNGQNSPCSVEVSFLTGPDDN